MANRAKHAGLDSLKDSLRRIVAFVMTLAILSTVWLFVFNGWDDVMPVVDRDKYRDVKPVVDVIATAPTEINPKTNADSALWRVLGHNVVATWLKTGKDGALEPELVDRWEQSADKMEWTFHLSKSLDWSDGSEITAGDLVRSLKDNIAAKYEYSDRLDLESVSAADDSTVIIKTREPKAVLPHLLSGRLGAVWSSKQPDGEMAGDSLSKKPVTSGPYEITGYSKTSDGKGTLTLEPTRSKLAADLRVSMVTVRWTGEADAKNDAATGAAQYAIADYDADFGDGTTHGQSTRRLAIAFNGQTDRPYPALSDKRFRQGIRNAVDSRAVLDAIGGGYSDSRLIGGGVTPGTFGYEDLTGLFPFDAAKGRSEATSYFGVYPFALITPDWSAGAGDVITRQLNAIVQYPHAETLDQAAYSQRLQSNDYDMALIRVDGYDGLKGLLDANSVTGVDAPDTTKAYDAVFTAGTEDELEAAVKNAARVQSDWSTVDWLGVAKTSAWSAKGWKQLAADLSDVSIDLTGLGKD